MQNFLPKALTISLQSETSQRQCHRTKLAFTLLSMPVQARLPWWERKIRKVHLLSYRYNNNAQSVQCLAQITDGVV